MGRRKLTPEEKEAAKKRKREYNKEHRKKWILTPKGQAYKKRTAIQQAERVRFLRETDPTYYIKRRAMIRAYIKTPRGRARQAFWKKQWLKTPKGKEYSRKQALKKYRKNPERFRAAQRKWRRSSVGRAWWENKGREARRTWNKTLKGKALNARRNKRRREMLHPVYIRGHFFRGIKNVPKELVEVKALQLKIKRKLKEQHENDC